MYWGITEFQFLYVSVQYSNNGLTYLIQILDLDITGLREVHYSEL